ncbi:MAG: BMP family ABC transporter substrate-binding protein, partial [Candidatus Bathyarchaeia archaeon]
MASRKTIIAAVAILVILIAVIGGWYWWTISAPKPPAYKVAILLPASIDSIGWPQLGYFAIEEIKNKFGVETAYTEWTTVAGAGGIAEDYIAAGYNIIIFHGGQYFTACEEIAKAHPDVVVVANAEVPLDYPNVWTLIRDDYLPYYAIGYMMALATKTGKIGFIGGLEFPTAVGCINLIYSGAIRARPDIKMYYVHSGDFDDPVKNKGAAEAQIAEGVDAFVPWLGGTGLLATLEAARAAPRYTYLVGACVDMYEIDKRFLTSIVMDVPGVYSYIVGKIIEGEKSGSVRLAEYCTLASTRGAIPKADEDYAMEL